MMNIAIVDDNKYVLKELSKIVLDICGEDTGIKTYSRGKGILDDIQEEMISPEIIFMDIELGIDNGIDIASCINDKLPLSQIIFVSAFDDYYLDVYDSRHVYFLKKPFEIESVSKAIDTAMKNIDIQSKDVLSFVYNRKTYSVNFNSISSIESNSRKIYLHCVNGEEFEFYGKLDLIAESLPDCFFRCHRSFVVNINHVSCQGRTELIMKTGEAIPISRRYSNIVKDAFIDYLSNNM